MKDKIIACLFVVVMMMMAVSAYAQIAVDEFHNKNELQKIQGYCFEHAVRAANGEAVVNDLIKAGLVDSQYYDMTCRIIEQLLQTCSEAFTEKFGRQPYYTYEFSICPKIEQNNVTK
jgi:hypothetical protein